MALLPKLSTKSVIQIAFALTGLLIVYLFQNSNYSGFLFTNVSAQFIINKSIRVLLNDIFMLIVIAALFKDKSITRFALWIQLVDFFILLPVYLILKLTLEGTSELSSPLLSQFHRLIVNPTFMILLVPAVYFQKLYKK